jgi:hypothetical protein
MAMVKVSHDYTIINLLTKEAQEPCVSLRTHRKLYQSTTTDDELMFMKS